ncbi:MAG: GNAT family N-acetyltransferase [Saprospiraceae bacterium]|nr:GNAT family N-acetyltransferase [Saprospiraceae bacterium]
MTSWITEEGRIDAVEILLHRVPEFDILPSIDDIRTRIKDVPQLVLTSHEDGVPVGFKIGYERDGRFYSWLGGVEGRFRKKEIASHLADYQEQWARKQGYSTIWMKTRNRFPQMLLMATRRGFRITGLYPGDKINEHRIVLEKSL